MKVVVHLSVAAFIVGTIAANGQTTANQRNMGIRKGMGLGYPLQQPHVAAPTHPRIAVMAGSHSPTFWSTFQTAPRQLAKRH